MSTQIILTFSSPNGRNSEKVEWIVRQTSLTDRWLKEMTSAIKNKSVLREQRFVGWQGNESTLKQLVLQLNESISAINQFYNSRYHIAENAYFGMPQDTLNTLHHHFEILMGQSWNPSDWMKDVPPHVFTAVRLLNDNIHDYESAVKAQQSELNGESAIRFFQFQLVTFRQLELTQQDLSEFSFACDMGDLVTNYCQLGKTWIEVYGDQDDEIHPENIAPLRYYSSSFNAHFFEKSETDSLAMTQLVKAFIKARGGNPEDPKNALGHIVYASLPSKSFLRTCSEKDRIDFFRERLNISEILIKNGAQEVKRKFSNPDSYYIYKQDWFPQVTYPLRYALSRLFNIRN